MFTHQHHLRHLLRPDQYTSEEQYRAELRHLFPPAWHPLATVHRPRPAGRLPHLRPARNADPDPQLRRRTAGVPERLPAPAQPADREAAGQHRAADAASTTGGSTTRTAGHGQDPRRAGVPPVGPRELLPAAVPRRDVRRPRVRLPRRHGPSLREWLGPLWDGWAERSAGAYRHAATWEKDFPCNWKVVLENSLESYHIPQVHPKTFKEFPGGDRPWHELDPAVHVVQDDPAAERLARPGDGLDRPPARRAGDERVLAPRPAPARHRRVRSTCSG